MDALIGSTFQQNNLNGIQQQGSGYTSDALLENLQAAPVKDMSPITYSLYKYNAIFGRLNLNWKTKYILNLTGRRDGSSRFGDNNKFHNFGSVGAAWLFTEEKWLTPLSSILSFGKLRLSYGTTGNDQIGDYRFYDLYLPNFYPYQGAISLIPAYLYNPELAWEQTKKFESAIELGFFDQKITFNGVYYRNVSSNQLLSYSLPLTTGFSSIAQNFPATVLNSGWEFQLNSTNFSKKVFFVDNLFQSYYTKEQAYIISRSCKLHL